MLRALIAVISLVNLCLRHSLTQLQWLIKIRKVSRYGSTLLRYRAEEFETSLGHIIRPCPRKENKIRNSTLTRNQHQFGFTSFAKGISGSSDRNDPHRLTYLFECLVFREWCYLRGHRRCSLVGVGVALWEEVYHWGWALGF